MKKSGRDLGVDRICSLNFLGLGDITEMVMLAGRLFGRIRVVATSIIAVICLAVIWWGAGQFFDAQQRTTRDGELRTQITHIADQLSTNLKIHLSALDSLEAFVMATENINHENDQEKAEHIDKFLTTLSSNQGVMRALALAPAGVITNIAPLTGNEAALGLNLLEDPSRGGRDMALEAIRSRKAVVNDPYELVQGGMGVIARKAVFVGERLWGLVSIVLDLDHILQENGVSAASDRLDLAIQDRTGKTFFGPADISENMGQVTHINLPSGQWKLKAAFKDGIYPASNANRNLFQAVVTALGGLLLGLGFVVYSRARNSRIGPRGAAEIPTAITLHHISSMPSALFVTAFAVACAAFFLFMENQRDANRRIILATDLDGIVHTFEKGIEDDVAYFELLAQQMRDGVLDEKTYQKVVSKYVADHPGLINVTWSGPQFIIRWTAPYEPNKQVIGLKLALPEPERASHLAKETRAPVFTRPFTVIQGKPAFEVYVPAYDKDGRYLGVFGGVYSIPEILSTRITLASKVPHGLSFLDPEGVVLGVSKDSGRELDPGLVLTQRIDQVGDGSSLRTTGYKSGVNWLSVLLAVAISGLITAIVYGLLNLRREVTKRRGVERNLVVALDRAEGANRIKSDFLANMSHELRTPLNCIIGFSYILKHNLGSPNSENKVSEYGTNINNSGQHLLELINDILDISKIEAGKLELTLETFDLRDVIGESMNMFREAAKSNGLVLLEEISGDIKNAHGDRRRVKQIFINLIGNAIKFTPNGKVEIKAWCVANGEVIVSIRDTGIGIAKHEISRVMEPFSQVSNVTSHSHEGSGLGLFLSKELIELHGGKLSIESEIGRGTCVFVHLPAQR